MKRIAAAFSLIVCLLVFAGCSDTSSSLVGKWIPEVTEKQLLNFLQIKQLLLRHLKVKIFQLNGLLMVTG